MREGLGRCVREGQLGLRFLEKLCRWMSESFGGIAGAHAQTRAEETSRVCGEASEGPSDSPTAHTSVSTYWLRKDLCCLDPEIRGWRP